MRTLLFIWPLMLFATFGLHVVFSPQVYIDIWWLDIPMHFAGGMGVGFFGLWLAAWVGLMPLATSKGGFAERMRRAFPREEWWWPLVIVLGAIAYVGPWWEQLETFFLAYVGVPIPERYIADTLIDYMMDALGAMSAWAAFYFARTRVQ